MLLKLNEGERVTVLANHSKETNSICIICFDGKKVYIREFPPCNPPKSEENIEPVDSTAKKPAQHTQPEIAEILKLLRCVTPAGPDSMHNLYNATNQLQQLQAGA